jgi:hypothetical protein
MLFEATAFEFEQLFLLFLCAELRVLGARHHRKENGARKCVGTGLSKEAFLEGENFLTTWI